MSFVKCRSGLCEALTPAVGGLLVGGLLVGGGVEPHVRAGEVDDFSASDETVEQ